MNSVTLVGRLTADPELRFTNTGTAVCEFSIAVDRVGTDETDFFDVVAWAKTAEAVSAYLAKGHQVGVSGSLRQHRWETPEGDKRSRVKVNANQVDFLTPKSNGTPAPAAAADEPEAQAEAPKATRGRKAAATA
jgi:single-strand DNA-binding protein